MRKGIIIFFLTVSLVAQAASVTATVDSYKSASLSGDVPERMSVTFVNNGGTKGQVGEKGSATLTLSNWPDATLQSITLYMHSNQSSGAATMSLAINDSAWQVAKGAFFLWSGTGGYSKDDVPVTVLKRALHIGRGSSLSLQIHGTANSVFLQEMVVEYTLTPPVPHTVTLQYPSPNGVQQMVLTESEARSGVDLPSVPEQGSELTHLGETWYWIGWCEQAVTSQSASPLYWETDDWYGPEEDVTLYALYTNAPEQTIRQDSACITGEYVLAIEFDETIQALADRWESGRITMHSIPVVEDADGHKQWQLDTLSSSYRYWLQFVADSVLIKHVATGSWIGYGNSSGSNKRCKWAWHRTVDGSLFIYADKRMDKGNVLSNCLTINVDPVTNLPYATYREDIYNSTFPYWRLFPTAPIPTSKKAKYSTLPTHVALPSVFENVPAAIKILDSNGRIVIRHENKMYNLLGNSLL